MAYSTANSAGGIGGDFQADGPTANGVRAVATATSGLNYGIFAKTNSAGGFAGYFQGNVQATGTLTAATLIGNGVGLTNVAPAGAAGGDLAGNYPNPTIKTNAVNSTRLQQDGASLLKVSGGLMKSDGSHIGIKAGANLLFEALTIESGGLALTRGQGINRAKLTLDAADNGTLFLADVNNKRKVTLGAILDGSVLGGSILANDANGTVQAGINVNSVGQGIVFGDTKSFKVPNPEDPETDIWYASVEGPEAAAYLRGTARLQAGRAFIPFPSHFQSVAVAPGMTVQLTPLSTDTFGLAVVQKSMNGITVAELKGGKGDFEFDWEVKCVRKGHENYRVVRPWDELINVADRKEAWEARTKSLRQKGIDPTPNRK